MKAFIVLACLAVASADPTLYGINAWGTPLVNPAAVSPFYNSWYNPNLYMKSAKDAAQQALMVKQLKQQEIQLAAKNAGNPAAEMAAYAAQHFTQNVEKQVVKGSPIGLYKREAEAEADAYTPAQAAALFGIFNPVPYKYGVKYYSAPRVAGVPMMSSYINAAYNPLVHSVFKREAEADAESDPTVILRSGLGLTSYANTLGYPYSTLASSVYGYPYGLRSYINTPLVGRTLLKREADPESESAILLNNGLTYASALRYPYASLRSSIYGLPTYGLRTSYPNCLYGIC